MAALSYLKQEDIIFLTNLIADITNELCECDCCKKEQGCSIFERVYIAANLLYKYVHLEPTLFSDNAHTMPIDACIGTNGIICDIYTDDSLVPTGVPYYTVIASDLKRTDGTNLLSTSVYYKNGTSVQSQDDLYAVSRCASRINILKDESCIDWNTISSRINSNSAQKHKFVNKSRKKLLSRFYKYLYDELSTSIASAGTGYVALTRDIFGSNANDVIANCLDECCN